MFIPATTLLAAAVGFLPAADAHWEGSPPCGSPTIELADTTPHGGLAYQAECRFVVNPTVPWSRQSLCILVVHEVGHLHGLDHIPGTVMDADNPYATPPAECPESLDRPVRGAKPKRLTWKQEARKQMAGQRIQRVQRIRRDKAWMRASSSR